MDDFTQYKSQSNYLRWLVMKGRLDCWFEGSLDGWAMSILIVLAARGIAVPDDVRARIIECSNLHQLRTGLLLAATVGSVRGMFDPDAPLDEEELRTRDRLLAYERGL